MSKKKSFKISIKGIDWTVYSQGNASYIREHGKDSEAITYPADRELYFNSSRFTPGFIRHELMHCYVASSGTNSSNLTADQIEELCCEIYEEHGPEMDVLVDKIVNFIVK